MCHVIIHVRITVVQDVMIIVFLDVELIVGQRHLRPQMHSDIMIITLMVPEDKYYE